MSNSILGGYDNPGVAGLALLRRTTPREWLRQPQTDLTVFRKHPAKQIIWKSGERGHFRIDKNSMYLGAASSALLGVGEPVWYDQPAFTEPAPSGCWHLRIVGGSPLLPAGFPPLFAHEDCWLYTPMVQTLARLGYTFELREAFLFPERHQCLRPFYEAFKAARETATPEEWKTLKRVYVVTFGLLARESHDDPRPGYIFRPNWYYSLISEANARMYMQVYRVWQRERLLPVEIMIDELTYPEPVYSLPMGPGIGQYKIKDV